MRVDGVPYRTIWPAADGAAVEAIDQTRLPHEFVVVRLASLEDVAHAIRTLAVRGAPLIGAAAAYGLWLGVRRDPSDAGLEAARTALLATRPTAVNLRWALDGAHGACLGVPPARRAEAARAFADRLADEDVAANRAIGLHGLPLLEAALARKRGGGPLNVLTHCNAGWLATVDRGTALAPVYEAVEAGLPVHVWVDETRPRNQGAGLTAWELSRQGVPHHVLVDSAAAHLCQRGLVDLCIVGADRVTAQGDVANKVGTYAKALAARDAGLPFLVAAPSSTVDWTLADGVAEIPIEERDPREVTHVSGRGPDGRVVAVRVTPEGSPAVNPAFDVTPARLVTTLVTERGACPATREGLLSLFPERCAAPAARGR